MLLHNVSHGVIISNISLVLQGVSRATAGNYSCVGFNAEGDGVSPPFKLNVLCEYNYLQIHLIISNANLSHLNKPSQCLF